MNVYPLHLPALRDRVDDIPRLVWFFIHRHQRQLGRHITKVPQALMTQLQQYAWPGNIRELRNVIERLSVLADSQVLTVDALPPAIAKSGQELAEADAPVRPVDDAKGAGRPDLTLDEVERHHILRTLERHRWNKKRVAGILGIDTKTLYNKLRRYGVPIGARGDSDATAPSS